jgi:hypothetical protein
MNNYFIDKTTGHCGVVITDKFYNKVLCKDCNIVTKGNTESNAKKTFTKKHKG